MRAFLAVVVLWVSVRPVAAQSEWTLEASVFRATAGYARSVSPRALIGVEIGFGFPQIDITVEPPTDDVTGDPELEEYLHVGVFTRVNASDRLSVDAGLRGSIAELWSCSASDCWPSRFGGAYVQPMFGGKRFRIGPRLTAGWIRDVEEGRGREGIGDDYTFTAAISPVNVRVIF